ncbi:MAG TPA: extracellular solute-binding protein [Steroidobacteraceae bacterium]|nr:extracellular solute-binding protein [Steroidobacteraceae bacterium]
MLCWIALAVWCAAGPAHADDHKLRILTWADYVPADLIAAFTQATGIEVEVTLSNNEEMISKLRATGGAGYDLVQPSQDRITSVQRDFEIYKPIDLSKVKIGEFQPALLDIVKRNATIDGKLYALPYLWGTDGLVVNTRHTTVSDFPDLCRPDLKGKTSIRLRRPILMAFAFAAGKDPFALYGDPKAYAALMDQVGATLIACKPNFKFFFDNKDQLLNGFRSGEIWAAAMWDTGGWTLNRENPDIQYVVPRSGALGWIDTLALPARGRNEAAAYAWINFVMLPQNAARVVRSVGNFSAAEGTAPYVNPRLKAQFRASFPADTFKKVHWYPAIPPGLEEIEGQVLDRIKAAD